MYAVLQTEKRTGWVNSGIQKPESVADHMYRMAMIALVSPSTDAQPLDVGKCVMMALVHDLAEAEVGDITPEESSGVSRVEKARLEDEAMHRIYDVLGGEAHVQAKRIRELYEEYEQRQTPEAKFVKDLDWFELCVQAVEYEDAQQIKIKQEFFLTTVPRIQHPVVKRWATELMEKRRQAWEQRGWSGFQQVYVQDDDVSNGRMS